MGINVLRIRTELIFRQCWNLITQAAPCHDYRKANEINGLGRTARFSVQYLFQNTLNVGGRTVPTQTAC